MAVGLMVGHTHQTDCMAELLRLPRNKEWRPKPPLTGEAIMLEIISGYATPADWLMAAQGLAIFAAVCFVTAWITGEW